MATWTHKVDSSVSAKMQVFTDDHSITGYDALASGDFLDINGSLGRNAIGATVIVRGTADVILLFNWQLKVHKFNESSADTTVTMPTDASGIKPVRLLAGTYYFNFPISSIQIVTLASSGATANNITVMVY